MQKFSNKFLRGLNTEPAISLYLISFVLIGIFLGRLADGYFSSSPWATIAGIVIGMIAGIWAIYKAAFTAVFGERQRQ